MTVTDTPATTGAHRRRGGVATPGSRGLLSGLLLLLLGVWGGLIAYVGPSFDYAYSPDKSWDWTSRNLFLSLLPGIATAVGGLLLVRARDRVTASVGGWLAAAAGAWYVVGPLLAPLWKADYLGTPVGSPHDVAVEQIGIFFGLGGAILLVAGLAIGRFSVVSVRDVGLGEERAQRRAEKQREAELAAEQQRQAEAAAAQQRAADAETARQREATAAQQRDAEAAAARQRDAEAAAERQREADAARAREVAPQRAEEDVRAPRATDALRRGGRPTDPEA